MAGKLCSSNGSLRNLKCRHRLEETQVLQSVQEVRIPVKSQPNVNDHRLVTTNSCLVSHNQRHLGLVFYFCHLSGASLSLSLSFSFNIFFIFSCSTSSLFILSIYIAQLFIFYYSHLPLWCLLH